MVYNDIHVPYTIQTQQINVKILNGAVFSDNFLHKFGYPEPPLTKQ